MDTIKNAFSMSAFNAALCVLNLNSMSKIFWSNFSPVYRQLLRDGPVHLAVSSYDSMVVHIVSLGNFWVYDWLHDSLSYLVLDSGGVFFEGLLKAVV